jgi:hypothetical protein
VERALQVISKVITDPLLTDAEALLALLICECRLIYQNKIAYDFVHAKMEPDFRKNHEELKKRMTSAKEVRECVNDILLMLYDN